jgi:thymidylate synthase (FAD)
MHINTVRRHPVTTDKFGTRPIDTEQPVAEIAVHEYGNVALLATYGSDQLIVDAARVSYGKGTKHVSDHRALIRYLLRNKHTSPFEQAEVTFYLRLPIFVVRQLIRHRMANVNEYSARYSELSEDFYIPTVEDIARQSTGNKQGRGDRLSLEQAEEVQQKFLDAQEYSHRTYRDLLDTYGIAREIARVPTSVGMYSEMYWKCDLHNFMHFLKLRRDAHAQKEIRDFADAMYECVRPYFPLALAAWEDYSLNAYTLSAMEIRMLAKVFDRFKDELHAQQWPAKPSDMSLREYQDFSRFLDLLLDKS